jgi:hypothetical protein
LSIPATRRISLACNPRADFPPVVALGISLDLGDSWRIQSNLEQVAAVAGGHDAAEAGPICQLLGLGHGIKARVRLKTGLYFTGRIHHNQLDGARADIYTGKTHPTSISLRPKTEASVFLK